MPVRLDGIPMRQLVARSWLCWEPIGGPGRQIMACGVNGQRVYAMEISEGHVDLAVMPWQAQTGRVAVL